jgi:hypothetical protein
MQEYPVRWITTELQEEIQPPSDSFFKKWEAMLEFFKK